ncbi:hypothetical protein N7526_007374 [Penicillium atrosanguineum]|nr:hypothetical protein N7526_007374 [Penicillium atrosanguineum]
MKVKRKWTRGSRISQRALAGQNAEVPSVGHNPVYQDPEWSFVRVMLRWREIPILGSMSYRP